MKYLLWFIAIIVLFLLQSVLRPFYIFPLNLPLILIVISLLFANFDFGLGLTLSTGIMLDLLSGTSDGTIAISLLIIFLGAYFLINFVLAREPSLIIVFSSVAVATLAYSLFFAGINFVFHLAGGGVVLNYREYFLIDLPKLLVFDLLFTYPVLLYYQGVEYLNQKFQKHGPEPIRH